jgi:hypothetical protein
MRGDCGEMTEQVNAQDGSIGSSEGIIGVRVIENLGLSCALTSNRPSFRHRTFTEAAGFAALSRWLSSATPHD